MTGADTFPGEGSLLIVAHPDDEILWFGSVVSEVEKIVVCFLNDPALPEMAAARQRVLEDHPFSDKMVCLGVDETRAFNRADWPMPEATKYGLRIVKAREIARAYRRCFRQLEKQLSQVKIKEAQAAREETGADDSESWQRDYTQSLGRIRPRRTRARAPRCDEHRWRQQQGHLVQQPRELVERATDACLHGRLRVSGRPP